MDSLWVGTSLWMYRFAFMLSIGVGVGLFWAASLSCHFARTVNQGIVFLFGALVGGRLGFVALAWAYFQGHLGEVFEFWRGGFAWFGALGGGLLALLVMTSLTNVSFWGALDDLIPFIGTLHVSVWLGCWLVGIAYGQQTSAWWGLPAVDEFGAVSLRVPLQGMGALGSAVFLGLALYYQHRYKLFAYEGIASSLMLAGDAALIFGLSFLRADFSRMWHNIRIDSWAAGVFFLLSALTFFSRILSGKRTSSLQVLND